MAPWATVAWVAVSTVAIYVSTLIAVRIAGRRTLAQISTFDIITTIALGSVMATTAVSTSARYAQGATAVGTLLVLQTVVAAARQRWPRLRRLVDFRPEVVVEDGAMHLSASPFGPQLTESELRSLLRREGVFDLSSVQLVIVEPAGQLSHARVGRSFPRR